MSDFAEFYRLYPRKVARLDAEKAWKQMLARGYEPSEIVAGAEAFAKQCRKEGKEQQYIPYPASWLRAGRWMDSEIQETIVPAKNECLMRKVKDLDELKLVLAERNNGTIPANLALDLKRAKTLEDLPSFMRNTMVPNLPDNVTPLRKSV